MTADHQGISKAISQPAQFIGVHEVFSQNTQFIYAMVFPELNLTPFLPNGIRYISIYF